MALWIFLALGFQGGGGASLRASGEDVPAIVALLLDTSGSIRPAELLRVRQLAIDVLEGLPPGSQVAVYTFDDAPRLVLPRSSDAAAVRKAVQEIHISGRYTALNDALYDASRYLRDSPPGRKAMVLITDGQDENSAVNLEDSLAVAQGAGIPVFAVGVGRVQERILRRIAKLTAGQYAGLGEASGRALASSILAAPLGVPGAPAPPASPAAPTSPAPAPRGAAPGESLERPRHVLFWAGGAVLALVLAGLVLLALRGRRSLCPTCGRELPAPLSPCVVCAGGARAATPAAPSPPDDEISQTVIARLDGTEEYLEKTVTLRERPALAITKGPGTGRVFEVSLESSTSLGRAKANDIVLEDVAISSQHCRIRPEEGRFVLHDLKSTNGTFVNDQRVSQRPLSEGDVIKIGETWLRFRKEQKRVGAPSPPGTSRGAP